MQLTVMDTADRDHELVAHVTSERTRLREGEVMWIGWHPAAHKARLAQNESPVVLIAQPNRLAQSTYGAAARPLPGIGCSFRAGADLRLACGHRALVGYRTRPLPRR